MRPWEVVSDNWLRLAHIGFHFSLLLGLGLLARRNLRSGRGDRRFAFRLACVLFALVMLQWLLAAHHVPERSEFELFIGGLYRGFFAFALGWLFYIVLEPYARRLWPRTMISWVRLLDGRVRDPQLGRDVLVGCLWGVGYSLLLQATVLVPAWQGGVPSRPDVPRHPAPAPLPRLLSPARSAEPKAPAKRAWLPGGSKRPCLKSTPRELVPPIASRRVVT